MHKTNFEEGTDARNNIVRCECGWAYSGTYHEVHTRALSHQARNNTLRWDDPMRKLEPDEKRQHP